MANGDKYTNNILLVYIGIKGSTISLLKTDIVAPFCKRRTPQLTVDTRFANAAADKVADLNVFLVASKVRDLQGGTSLEN